MIDPRIVGDLKWAQGSYDCMYGTIATDWKMENNSFQLRVDIPPNTLAIVYLPATGHSNIFENSRLIEKNKEIKWLGYEKGKAKLKLGSGSYFFVVKD